MDSITGLPPEQALATPALEADPAASSIAPTELFSTNGFESFADQSDGPPPSSSDPLLLGLERETSGLGQRDDRSTGVLGQGLSGLGQDQLQSLTAPVLLSGLDSFL